MLDKLKKIRGRGVAELKTRGRQSFTAFVESFGLGDGGLPSDEQFWRLLDKQMIGDVADPDLALLLLAGFQKNDRAAFFPVFDDREKSVQAFQKKFGAPAVRRILERAIRAANGKFDLLGFSNLDCGTPVDWHREPLTKTRSALKHWKKFDELDTSETGDKKIVWELNRHQHFFDFGAAYWLTDDEKFAAAFVRQLTSWMRENPPSQGVNWISSLEIALRSISWLWALHFFKDSPNVSAQFFADVLKSLYAHGRHIEKYLSTFFSPNTHLTGEALALYYLGVLLPQLNCAQRWRRTGAKILLAELDRQFLTDGVYFERTTWYQRYTIEFYTHFLILSVLNEEDELSPAHAANLESKLQPALDFAMYTTRPDGMTPLIGDDDGGAMLPRDGGAAVNDFRSCLAVGAVLFNRGDYKFVAANFSEKSFWLLGATGAENFAAIKPEAPPNASKHFAKGGYFAMRDAWSPDANFLLVDGGKHGALGGGHAHADALAFELTVAGRATLVDAGTYTYHESEATRNYFRGTAAHNSLVLDGVSSSEFGGKFSWKTMTDAQTAQTSSHHRFDFFEGAHDGFSRLAADKNQIITHTRSILFLHADYWILRDAVKTIGTHEYELNFHFAPDSKPAVEGDGAFVFNPPTVNKKADGLQLVAFGDNGAWRITEDFISPCYGLKLPTRTAKFVSQGVGQKEFFTFLLPSFEEPGKIAVKEIAARGGRGFVIDFKGWRDWLIYGDGENSWVENELFGSNFRFAWARFDTATLDLMELILIGGSKFVFNQAEILHLPKSSSYVYARRIDGILSFENFEGGLGETLSLNSNPEQDL